MVAEVVSAEATEFRQETNSALGYVRTLITPRSSVVGTAPYCTDDSGVLEYPSASARAYSEDSSPLSHSTLESVL